MRCARTATDRLTQVWDERYSFDMTDPSAVVHIQACMHPTASPGSCVVQHERQWGELTQCTDRFEEYARKTD